MSGRQHAYPTAKKALLGNRTGKAAPAWREQASDTLNGTRRVSGAQRQQNVQVGVGRPASGGSKILMSDLPKDVGQEEVEELLRKTIGPTTDVYVVYNTQNRSKGVAVATFARPGDAVAARQKYHGKIVDGKTPLKIEIVLNDIPSTFATNQIAAATIPTRPVSLAERMGPRPSAPVGPASLRDRVGPPANLKNGKKNAPAPATQPVPAKRVRTKKGPKRVKKAAEKKPATAMELDQELDGYRAQGDAA